MTRATGVEIQSRPLFPVIAMSHLYIASLKRFRDRLLNPKALRPVEVAELERRLTPEQRAIINLKAAAYEGEADARIVENGLTPPSLSQEGGAFEGQMDYAETAWKFHTAQAKDRREEIGALEGQLRAAKARLQWEIEMAESVLNGVQWHYEKKLNDADRMFWEKPVFPLQSPLDMPWQVEHRAQLYWPDELSPRRRAILEVVDEIIEQN